ncbi:MAG TPA: methyltransferase domain-containing protein [Chloroflexota bacterium]|nr:methyltransferase domain-containing protein [Chloroflexota bacterium]
MLQLLAALIGLVVSAVVARRLTRPAPAALARPFATALLTPAALGPGLPVEPGMRVLLLGPAAPSWVQALRAALGRYGRLYVAEPDAERARALRTAVRAAGLGAVEVLAVEAGVRVDLPDSSVDLVVAIGSLAGRPRRQRLLWELQRLLRPGGYLAVSEGLYGARYLRLATLRDEARAVGLDPLARHGTPLAYTATFRKPR